jgi:hypothetical protein
MPLEDERKAQHGTYEGMRAFVGRHVDVLRERLQKGNHHENERRHADERRLAAWQRCRGSLRHRVRPGGGTYMSPRVRDGRRCGNPHRGFRSVSRIGHAARIARQVAEQGLMVSVYPRLRSAR